MSATIGPAEIPLQTVVLGIADESTLGVSCAIPVEPLAALGIPANPSAPVTCGIGVPASIALALPALNAPIIAALLE